jgi:hypothetical protein
MKNKNGGQKNTEPAATPPDDTQTSVEMHGNEAAGMAEDTQQESTGPEQEAHGINLDNDAEQTPEHEETEAHHQPHHQYQPIQLQPGYAIEPATGRIFQISAVPQYPAEPGYTPLHDEQPVLNMASPQPTPQQTAEMAARQVAAQQRHGQIIHSVEQFLEGNATVSDVVKTLYVNTTQDDQLWKGVIVGAAAAVLLTSKPVRQAMGKTLGGVFPGLKDSSTGAIKTEKK